MGKAQINLDAKVVTVQKNNPQNRGEKKMVKKTRKADQPVKKVRKTAIEQSNEIAKVVPPTIEENVETKEDPSLIDTVVEANEQIEKEKEEKEKIIEEKKYAWE